MQSTARVLQHKQLVEARATNSFAIAERKLEEAKLAVAKATREVLDAQKENEEAVRALSRGVEPPEGHAKDGKNIIFTFDTYLVPMPPHLIKELEDWSAHYPALAGVAKQAAAPPPPEVQDYSEADLDRMATAEQTSLAKKVEMATKQERLAMQEVQRRLERFNKAKATMEDMQRNHPEAEQAVETATVATRAADTEMSLFNVMPF